MLLDEEEILLGDFGDFIVTLSLGLELERYGLTIFISEKYKKVIY